MQRGLLQMALVECRVRTGAGGYLCRGTRHHRAQASRRSIARERGTLSSAGKRSQGVCHFDARSCRKHYELEPERELQSAVTEGRYEEEGWRVRKDGSHFWASVVITPLTDEAGKLRGFSKVTRDVTERKHAKELLQESEQRHRKLFDNNPHPTWVYDRQTLRFLAVNAAAIRKYGYSSDQFLEMTIKDIRPPEDVPALLESVNAVRDGNESAGVWRHRQNDGTVIDVEITSYALNFGGREADVVVAVDVTQRKRDEAEKRKFAESLAASNQELELRNREA